MQRKYFLPAICLNLLLFSGLFSQTVTHTRAFSGIPNLQTTLSFEKFSIGAPLTGVEVTVRLNTEGGYAGGDAAVRSSGVSLNIQSDDVRLLTDLFQPAVKALPAVADITVPAGETIQAIPALRKSSGGSIGSRFFSDFTGTGTFNLKLDVSNVLNMENPSEQGIFCPPTCSGTVEITYTY